MGADTAQLSTGIEQKAAAFTVQQGSPFKCLSPLLEKVVPVVLGPELLMMTRKYLPSTHDSDPSGVLR